jgi:hypothetical protein
MWQTAKGLKNKDLTGQFATLPARQQVKTISADWPDQSVLGFAILRVDGEVRFVVRRDRRLSSVF